MKSIFLRQNPLAFAISGALFLGLVAPAIAQFPAEFQLSDLNGTNGFMLDGEAAFDRSGFSVSAAGDINGDGIADLIVGAPNADPNGSYSGRSYVVFGNTGGFTSPLQLSALDGSNGFKLDGEAAEDQSGRPVSAAGDVNGDGIADLIIGAPTAGPSSSSSGRSYVVFGKTGGFTSPLPLSALDGSNGFMLDGEAVDDNSGYSVSAAGDINGDGVDDLIIGTFFAGRSYIVFGKSGGFISPVQLSVLNGTTGFMLVGEVEGDLSGHSVGTAGDINGDGLDDLIVGAPAASPNGNSYAGRSYVIFGQIPDFPSELQLSDLNGANGFKIDGEVVFDNSGVSVGTAGDFNGDGVDDVIIGADRANAGGNLSGRSYVVFGRTESFPPLLQLSSLDGSNGIKLDGVRNSESSGRSVSTAGDINGDGIDDLIVGAPARGSGNIYSGRSYVVFGNSEFFTFATMQLSDLDGTNGFKLNGEVAGDYTGRSVSAAGDVNGDGVDDLIVGAPYADPNDSNSGRSYVVFGLFGEAIFKNDFED